ncbi:MAG: hypothetical protein ABF489_08105 [Bifidobacterium sp.]|uniref:hypothetical protein n=1 Tax=Bifidobacterium sp. TaxID=41200 RepID=UPI0039ED485F
MNVDEQTKRRNSAGEQPSRHSKVMRGVVTPALGIIAVAFIILGVLNATIWQPTRRVVAKASTNSQYVVTDPGVLQVVDSKVKVKVVARNDDARVCLALGSPQDVTGWLGDESYTRLTGLSSWTALSHRNVASSADSTSDAVSFSDSDLWSRVVCGDGEAEITTSEGTAGQVLLINADTASSDASSSSSGETAGQQTNRATISMDWTRQNLPDYAMPFYFVAGLLIAAAILAASVFAIDPSRRRKQQNESELKKIEETEMSVMEAVAGAMRPLAGEIRSTFRKTPESHKRHAHGSSSKRTRKRVQKRSLNHKGRAHAVRPSDDSQLPATPRVIDVGSKNMVAAQQTETQAQGHAQGNEAPVPSVASKNHDRLSSLLKGSGQSSSSSEETAVISPEELQSYFARFTAETTGEIAALKDGAKSDHDPAVKDVGHGAQGNGDDETANADDKDTENRDEEDSHDDGRDAAEHGGE